MRDIVTILYLLIGIINLFVGLLVLIKSRKKTQATIFFIFILIIEGWLATNYFSHILDNQELSLLLARGTYFFGALIVPIFILFVYYFPARDKMNKYIITLVNLPILVVIYFSFTSYFVEDLKISNTDFNIYVNGSLIWLYSIFIGAYVLMYLFLFYRKYRIQNPIDKLRLKYVVAGFTAATFIGLYFDLIIAAMGDEFADGIYGPMGTVFISLSVAYAILRFRLMDINIIIRKSLIQIVTFAILFGLYAYILIFAQRASVDSINLGDNTALLLAILIIAITIEPLRKLIYKWIDNLFDSKERDRKELLQRMKVLTASSIQFESLKKKTIDELSKILGSKVEFYIFNKERDSFNDTSVLNSVVLIIKKGEILIKDEFQHNEDKNLEDTLDFMNKKNISGMIPIGKADELLGVFIVNDSDTSSVYTKDRIEFMNNFASQVEFAFASSLAYKHAIERIKI